MDNKIKNIVFDLGGVLINLDFENCLSAFRKAGFTDADKRIKEFNREGFFMQFELGNITSEEFRDAVRQHTSSSLTDRKIDDMWNLMLLDIPRQKLDLLLDLRGRYMVYLLSNTNRIHWEYCSQMFNYRGFQVKDYFEERFLSFEMHKAKPSPEVYGYMLTEANLLPEETFFIDDSEANCRAAATLGIHTHHYQPGEDLTVLFD